MNDPGHTIRLRSSARTSVGQVRDNNEDNVRLWSGEHFVLAVVADGMGGAAAGEEASRIAVETIQTGLPVHETSGAQSLEEMPNELITDRLRESILTANVSIIDRAVEEPDMRGMGTTITLAFVRNMEVLVAHVGDSRAYHISAFNGAIEQITSDHSFVQALLTAGHITHEQAEEHPMRNVLYRALGQTENLDVDLYNTTLQDGDRLVLCSDGLTRHVRPEEIAQIALSDENPDATSQEMIDLANARGGEDNVSVIVVQVESDQPAASAEERTFVEQEDDEDTLLLKDRARPDTQLPETPDDPEMSAGGWVESPRRTVEDQAQIDRRAEFLSKYKMEAERLSDLPDDLDPDVTPVFRSRKKEDTQDSEDRGVDMDKAISQRPEGMDEIAMPSSYENKSDSHQERINKRGWHNEGEGEGQDTMRPEQ